MSERDEKERAFDKEDFEGRKEDIVKGVVPLATVLNDLVRGA